MKRRRTSRNYFTIDTEHKICEYLTLPPGPDRDFLYHASIYPALDKLVENVIHTYKFYHYDTVYDDLKLETISYIHERLHKFNGDRGKAFSYFTIVARNYLIQKNKEIYKSKVDRDDLLIVDDIYYVDIDDYSGLQSESHEFITLWVEWGLTNLNDLFNNATNKTIAESIFVLFRDSDDIDIFNKKALYVLIREQTKINKTSSITKVVKLLKHMYVEMYTNFLNDADFDFIQYVYKRD